VPGAAPRGGAETHQPDADLRLVGVRWRGCSNGAAIAHPALHSSLLTGSLWAFVPQVHGKPSPR
jgi:hypothetical protein